MKRKVKESCNKNKPLQQKTQWASQVKYGCETSKIYVMYFIIQNEILNICWQVLHELLNGSPLLKGISGFVFSKFVPGSYLPFYSRPAFTRNVMENVFNALEMCFKQNLY